jgi:hypothetical protein
VSVGETGGCVDEAVLSAALSLGTFDLATLSAVTSRPAADLDKILQDNPAVFGRVNPADTDWRVIGAPALAAPPPSWTPDLTAAETLLTEALASFHLIERGLVHDAEARRLTLELAEQRIDMARSLGRSDDAARLGTRLAGARRRVRKLRDAAAATPDRLLETLVDWTLPLTPGARRTDGEPFTLEALLKLAAMQAATPNAVFRPAHEALGNGIMHSAQRADFALSLDQNIRGAALKGQTFHVLALGCVAAVSGLGSAADALTAAITTPAFRSVADRTSMRIAYTALSNLSRPGTEDAQRAVEACAYLLRRERPGRDEMELLAPAALQSSTTDANSAINLIARWLKWEHESDPEESDGGWSAPALTRFGHFARNLGCALDASAYVALEKGLPSIADDDLGVILIRHLSDRRNKALDIRTLRPEVELLRDVDRDEIETADTSRRQYGTIAREPVAQLTDPERKRDYTYLPLQPRSLVAKAIEDLVIAQRAEQVRPDLSFTVRRRHWAQRNA